MKIHSLDRDIGINKRAVCFDQRQDARCNYLMLGRLRKTSRLDVGLAIVFSGLSYLVWSLIAGGSRALVQQFIDYARFTDMSLPTVTRAVKIFFVDTGFVIDIVGLAWLVGSMVLVLLGSKQKISISWAWVCAICQSFTAGLGAVLVGGAVYAPHILIGEPEAGRTPLAKVSQISLPVLVPVAILTWTVFVVWLLVSRARLDRRGPSLRDGLRSNVQKS